MKTLTNLEINNANIALNEIAEEPIKGAFKFKVLSVKAELERAFTVLISAVEGVTEEEEIEMLEQTQDLNIPIFTVEELEPLPLSLKQLTFLKPIINFEEEQEEQKNQGGNK